MRDDKRFRVFSLFATFLVVIILSYNLLQGYLLTGFGAYIKRRIYYETVISKKGLSLHRAEYWRKKD
jgi:hypothetical protein